MSMYVLSFVTIVNLIWNDIPKETITQLFGVSLRRGRRKRRGVKTISSSTFHSRQVARNRLYHPLNLEHGIDELFLRLTSINSELMCVPVTQSVCDVALCASLPLSRLLLSNRPESHLVQQPLPLTLAPPGRLHY